MLEESIESFLTISLIDRESLFIIGEFISNVIISFNDSISYALASIKNSLLLTKYSFNCIPFGMEFCKLFFPKNVIIMGSDDIMSPNYVKVINQNDNFDVVGFKTWKRILFLLLIQQGGSL